MPLLVDLQPAGRFLMEDFHRAGGLLAVLREVRDLLDPAALTVTGRPLVDYLDDAPIWDPEVIRGRARAAAAARRDRRAVRQSRARRRGDQAGRRVAGAAAATAAGRWSSTRIEDMHARIDDPDLDVDADSVLVLRGCGPKGYPGMPEVANMPLPTKLLQQGVRDMVRVCDGRMSGTAYGTVVLHVAPEAAAGGPLGLVRTGDDIVLDVPNRGLDIDVPAAELAARRPNAATIAGFASPAAAGSGCMSTTSCRPTPGPTWTSWSAPAATRCPVNRTESRVSHVEPGPRPTMESHVSDAHRRARCRKSPSSGSTTRPTSTSPMSCDDFNEAFFGGAAGGLAALRTLVDERVAAGAVSQLRRRADRRADRPAAPDPVHRPELLRPRRGIRQAVPDEPILFTKSPNTLVGPERRRADSPGLHQAGLGGGARHRHRPAGQLPGQRGEAAAASIAGYVLVNDVSERAFQMERGGQWAKGKSAETFNPAGPVAGHPRRDRRRPRPGHVAGRQRGAAADRVDVEDDLRPALHRALPEPVHGAGARRPDQHRHPARGRAGHEAADLAAAGRRR